VFRLPVAGTRHGARKLPACGRGAPHPAAQGRYRPLSRACRWCRARTHERRRPAPTPAAASIAATGLASLVCQRFPLEVYNPLVEVVAPLLAHGFTCLATCCKWRASRVRGAPCPRSRRWRSASSCFSPFFARARAPRSGLRARLRPRRGARPRAVDGDFRRLASPRGRGAVPRVDLGARSASRIGAPL